MLGDYKKFIKTFLNQGYECIFFDELNTKKNKQLIIRHDIDIDCNIALELSKMESCLGVKSTYFFLLTNDSYNLLSDRNIKIVKNIQKHGHKISLHFDPSLYENVKEGLGKELRLFEYEFGHVDIISLHRPEKKYFYQGTEVTSTPLEFNHTYQDKYFKDIKYFADSRGGFRYGDPIDSPEFKNQQNIQLLTHPFWWVIPGVDRYDCVNNIYDKKCFDLKRHLKNSIGFYNG